MFPFSLSTIGQIAIEVRNIEIAVSFYRDKLGMKYLFSAPPSLAFFDCNGIRLMLTTPENSSEILTNSTIYFKVDEIQKAFQTFSERGISFDDSPHLIARMLDHELWMTFFRDPDHNLLGIMCEIPLETIAD